MSNATTEARKYRATFILDTREHQGELEDLFTRYRQTIEALGCTINQFEDLGSKDFVRVTDRHHPADIYLQIYVEGAPEIPKAIQERFRLDKTVKRIFVESA